MLTMNLITSKTTSTTVLCLYKNLKPALCSVDLYAIFFQKMSIFESLDYWPGRSSVAIWLRELPRPLGLSYKTKCNGPIMNYLLLT